jgi:hypothetical protein
MLWCGDCGVCLERGLSGLIFQVCSHGISPVSINIIVNTWVFKLIIRVKGRSSGRGGELAEWRVFQSIFERGLRCTLYVAMELAVLEKGMVSKGGIETV